MFNALPEFPVNIKRKKQKQAKTDILMPGLNTGVFGHVGRHPNTDHHVRLLEYKQKMKDADNQALAEEAKRMMKDTITGKYDRHVEKSVFKRHIRERYEDKVKLVEAALDEKRERLRKLFCEEEQEFIRETVDLCQKATNSQFEEMKLRAQQLKEAREAERLEIVKKKRMQQYTNDSTELKPILFKRNLVDSKMTHLEQMREKEMRIESEKEIDFLWYQLSEKLKQARMEREVHDLLEKDKTKREMMDTWAKQLEGRRILNQEAERIMKEDRIEMEKMAEQLRREEIEGLDSKRRKRDKVAKELLEQIAAQEQFFAQRKQEEEAIDKAMDTLAQIEIEKERQKMESGTMRARRETAIYRRHLKELDAERKREDQELADLLEVHRKAIQQKQDDARCKIKFAKEQLKKSVLEGRAQQLEYKRLEAENQLKLQQAENELLRMACETNERLQAETDRLQHEQVREYREQLKDQIEQNNEKRRLEREELERELAEGLREEERRLKLVEEVIKDRLASVQMKHPFGRLLEKGAKETCRCPWTGK